MCMSSEEQRTGDNNVLTSEEGRGRSRGTEERSRDKGEMH